MIKSFNMHLRCISLQEIGITQQWSRAERCSTNYGYCPVWSICTPGGSNPKALFNFEWVMRHRVNGSEVELSRDQEDDGPHRGEASVASGLALGVEQAVDARGLVVISP